LRQAWTDVRGILFGLGCRTLDVLKEIGGDELKAAKDNDAADKDFWLPSVKARKQSRANSALDRTFVCFGQGMDLTRIFFVRADYGAG
jgi:hypothetical protein